MKKLFLDNAFGKAEALECERKAFEVRMERINTKSEEIVKLLNGFDMSEVEDIANTVIFKCKKNSVVNI